MVNLDKCHHSVGRNSPKNKPKHTAKWVCVLLTSIWVIALAPWDLVLNRRRSRTTSLTKKRCPTGSLSQLWLERKLSFTWPMSSKIWERFNWCHNLEALGFNHVLGTETALSPSTSDISLSESTLLLKNGFRPQAYEYFKEEKQAGECHGGLLPVSSIPPAASSTSSHARAKLCATVTVVWTGLREWEQVETHLPNTTAARGRLWLPATVLCQFKPVELQRQPDCAAGKSYWVFVGYNGKGKKTNPVHLLQD